MELDIIMPVFWNILLVNFFIIQIRFCLLQAQIFPTLKDSKTKTFIAGIQEFVRDKVAKVSRPSGPGRWLEMLLDFIWHQDIRTSRHQDSEPFWMTTRPWMSQQIQFLGRDCPRVAWIWRTPDRAGSWLLIEPLPQIVHPSFNIRTSRYQDNLGWQCVHEKSKI